MQYIADLSSRTGIKLNKDQPFIQYKTLAECPKGLFPGRIYPNYESGEIRKLTETLMANDLLHNLTGTKVKVVNTRAENNERPNTSTTARDAAEAFVQKILSSQSDEGKEFTILLQTNNPYIKRQEIATQQEVNKVLTARGLDKQGYKVKVEGVGFSSKQDVATVNSELGALVSEMWKMATPNRDSKDLEFQTRKCAIPPALPTIEGDNTFDIIRELQYFFDSYTD